jgi:hypothetical protein
LSASLNDRPNKVTVVDESVTVTAGAGVQGPKGDTGPTGPAGPGVPAGGAAGDLLVKNSGTNYDTAWTDAPTVDLLAFDTAAAETPTVGELAWDTDEGTLALGMNGGGVTGRLMEHSFYRVKADEAISKGDLCMAVGTVGNSGVILVAKARTSYGALTNIPSQRLIGLAAANIASGDEGLVVAFGKVRRVNTAAFAEGDILYADPATPGGLTVTAPTAPNWKTIVALVITDSATVGELFVRVAFGSQLSNDESVTLTSPTSGQLLKYNGTVWVNSTVTASDVSAAPATPTVGTSLGTTGTIDLDMSALNGTYQSIALSGNPTFTTSNRAAGRTVTVKLAAGGSSRTLAFPGWTFVGAAAPSTLAANKVGVFTVTMFDTTDAAAVCAYAAQP